MVGRRADRYFVDGWDGVSVMEDRELLELAAKAVGEEVEWLPTEKAFFRTSCSWPQEKGWFNPMHDDGEAIRIAVKLGMDIEINDSNVYAGCRGSFSQPAKPDPCAALRRAIVMAAADIGNDMP